MKCSFSEVDGISGPQIVDCPEPACYEARDILEMSGIGPGEHFKASIMLLRACDKHLHRLKAVVKKLGDSTRVPGDDKDQRIFRMGSSND